MPSSLSKELEQVTSTFKTFTTNQGMNTLENHLKEILTDGNVKYFDILIGYFRMSGFNKINDYLNDIDEVRILIGINTENKVFEATELINKFAIEQIEDWEQAVNDDRYKSILSILELLRTNKLKIKVSPNNDNHSKLYILRNKNEFNGRLQGGVIIGSSNLTHNGLSGNFEINTELRQDADIEEATKLFNVLWNNAEELTLKDVEDKIIPKLKNYPPKQKEITEDNITPYQLYIKLLIEHFGSKIDFINDDNIFVPKGYKKLSYQVEAVNDGIEKLDKHNGFFLSDVVGLGKTVVIAMMIKKLEATLKKGVLIVIPPAIRTQWNDTFKEFEISNYHIESLASLNKIDASKYELIIVDESHKFKNIKAKRYEELSKICRAKKVILLSATPQNNSPKDLHSQLNLFQNMKNSTIPNCQNLDRFFNELEPQYKQIINNTPIDKNALKTLSIQLRDKVVRDIMIRRTRTDIQEHDMYSDDFKSQGLTIPKVNELNEHTYKMDNKLSIKFEETAKILVKDLIYTRFNPLAYLTPEAREKHYPNESDNIFEFNPLAGLMKISLVKRFESSFKAFDISINRHLYKYTEYISNFQDGRVYLGDKATDVLAYDNEIDGDYDDFISRLKDKGKLKELTSSDFTDNYLEDLIKDKKQFEILVEKWKNNKQDPKLDKFIEEINKQKLSEDTSKKIVVFTESTDTLEYLSKHLPNKEKILFITSHNRDINKTIIRENFDANYDSTKQKNDYNVIVTTDTLSEGINLHRSNIIYNYDIPWNATKLIQRIGRVNRIGTTADFIDVHNFKPSANIDVLIGLNQKAYVKLQSSHIAYGEDNKIYTEDEEVSTVKLFNEYQKTSNQDRDEELDYLEELRTFKSKNLDEFNLISNLPQDLKTCRAGKLQESYVVLDIDNNKNYFYVDDKDVKSINFLEIAKAMKSDIDEVSILVDSDVIENYINRVVENCKASFRVIIQDKDEGKIDGKSEQIAVSFLKEWLTNKIITREEFKTYRKNIQEGSIGINNVFKINNLNTFDSNEINTRLKEIFLNNEQILKQNNTTKQTINILLSQLFKVAK